MESTQNTSSSVCIHPLVIMNCSDHCNRVKYIEPKQTRVLGILLGKQEGKTVEIINSFEIKFAMNNQVLKVDDNFVERRLKAYKVMFPNLDCLGWYSSGPAQSSDFPDAADLQIQKSVINFCESPIYMIMNTSSEQAKNKKQIPIFLYETNQVAKKFS